MYLLNPRLDGEGVYTGANLHSTMYLLNPSPQGEAAGYAGTFTFHYVSIKSHTYNITCMTWTNLHSTMYLLNPPFP